MIHLLLGTRAQLIKMAPVIREIERRGLPLNLVFTGQHQVTMAELLEDFQIRARPRLLYDGREVAGVAQMAVWLVRCLWRLWWRRAHWFGGRRPAVVVVHGDTVSTLLGALAGKLVGLPVAHVESGLRSFRWFHPFPEELTRLAVFRLADIAYCPGAWAAENLRSYGLRVVDTTENTIVDAVCWARQRAPAAAATGDYYVASIHRFENLLREPRLRHIVSILEGLARRARCIFVLHPVTESRLRSTGLLEQLARNPAFELRPRMAYTQFVALLAGARFVVTDGGSNQEELSWLGVPTVLMRAATERQEGLGRTTLLSGYDAKAIANFLDASAPRARSAGASEIGPSRAIVDDLENMLKG